MKSISLRHCIMIAVMLLSLVLPSLSLAADTQEKILNDDSLLVAGLWRYMDNKVAIGGMVYDGGGWGNGNFNSFATFDIRNWDHFIANIGIHDNFNVAGAQRTIIEVDGDPVWQQDIQYGQKALFVDIPLTGKRTLTLRWKSGSTLFAEPKLTKGNPIPQFACPLCTGKFNTQTELTDHIKAIHAGGNYASTTTPQPLMANPGASFVVDPSDLDKLTTNLRKRVDAKPDLQQKLANGFMAIMSFNLIDIPSPSVAQNVAEDLSTRLINADFNLVERGQLDKALKELKIQDSALIDQATAQKLGQVTGCNYILVGSVSDRGQFIVMNARVLETSTGKAVAAESVECRKIPIQR